MLWFQLHQEGTLGFQVFVVLGPPQVSCTNPMAHLVPCAQHWQVFPASSQDSPNHVWGGDLLGGVLLPLSMLFDFCGSGMADVPAQVMLGVALGLTLHTPRSLKC